MMLSQIASSLVTGVIERPPAIPDATDESLLSGALNLVFITLASIAFIVLVLQGVKYTLSAGEPDKTKEAKNGIIYALIGITVASTSWSLLNFTVNRVIVNTNAVAETSALVDLLGSVAGFIALVGAIVATIVIFIGIIQLNVSGGNLDGAKKARDRIIYALIGLVVITAAGPILAFVIDKLRG